MRVQRTIEPGSLAYALKKYRRDSGVSLMDVARYVNATRDAVRHWEKGVYPNNEATMNRLNDMLGTSFTVRTKRGRHASIDPSRDFPVEKRTFPFEPHITKVMKQSRKDLKITIAKVAELMHITPYRYQSLESGRLAPTPQEEIAIYDLLGIEADEI